MISIVILAVGRLKEKFWLEAQKEYQKRLSAYLKLEIIEVQDEGCSDNPSLIEEVKRKEFLRLQKRLNPNSFLIVLDREGKSFSSKAFAKKLENLTMEGKSHFTLVIGGSWGLDEELIKKADLKLSFSKFTFPHQLMRIILLEQVYRSFKITKGEPYHK